MSRIVITTIGSFGDLHPKIAIALELRKRGHHVVFATHEGYQQKIEALGFEFHRMRPDNTALSDPQEMARIMDLKTGTEYVICNWICANLRETYTDLMNSAKDADFIIAGEAVVAARLVAEKLGIPWAFAVLQPVSFLSAYDPSVIPVFPFLAKLRGFGSILLIGKNPPPENLSEDIIAASYAPYSQIFPRACAIAHQGGIGTTAQALRAGCPTIVMPYSHDQPDNAARVERLGTSRTIPRKQYSASRVAKALGELLDNPNYAAKAAEIGEIIQAEDGVSVACDAIEKQF